MQGKLAAESTMIHYYSMFEEAWLALPTFHWQLNATVTGIQDDCVTYKDQEGAEHAIPCDSVVVSLGMKPLTDEALSFYGSADPLRPGGRLPQERHRGAGHALGLRRVPQRLIYLL